MKIPQHEERIIRIASYASVAAAASLIVMKFFAWWVTHSVSMQASLIDSLLDVIASFINMIAIYQSLKPADLEHRYGHGKVEALAALGQAFFIGGSSIWLIYEAMERFQEPEVIEQTGMGIIVMLMAIAITLGLLTYQRYVIKETQSTAIKADMLHFKSDLLVNIAVILSLMGAQFFHIRLLDPILGLLIGIYILWTAWKILMQALDILMDRELDEEERRKILTIINEHNEVIGVKDLRTRQSGLQQFFQLNLMMDPSLGLREADKIASEVEKEVIKAYPKCQVMIRLVPELHLEENS